MESEDEVSSSSASTSNASDEYGDDADVLPDEEAIPDDELYAVSHIGRRRMNPVTGAIEYLTFWSGYVEPTWEPAENLSAAVEPLRRSPTDQVLALAAWGNGRAARRKRGGEP